MAISEHLLEGEEALFTKVWVWEVNSNRVTHIYQILKEDSLFFPERGGGTLQLFPQTEEARFQIATSHTH